jgi:hypothetical protein
MTAARHAARLSLAGLLFTTALLAVDRTIAGLIMCSDLGLLPW